MQLLKQLKELFERAGEDWRAGVLQCSHYPLELYEQPAQIPTGYDKGDLLID